MFSDYSISPLGDLSSLVDFFESQTNEYLKYFHPFKLDYETLEDEWNKEENEFWVVEYEYKVIAFFMLRFAKGYTHPSFGFVVGEEFKGKGIGSLCFDYALTYCRVNDLKMVANVEPQNYSSVYILHVKNIENMISYEDGLATYE